MVSQWFRSPTALILIPLLLLLMGAVACGSTSEQSDTDAPADTQAKDTGSSDKADTKTDTTKTDTKSDATKSDTMKDGGVSQPKDAGGAPEAMGKGMERLVIAVSPLGWDTNYSYKVTTSGLLDKRPILEYLIANDRKTGAYSPELTTWWEMSPNGKTWSFTLQEGIKWQAGPHRPPEGWGDFTAEDVKHSFWLLIHPDSAASGIKNWLKMTGGTKGMTYPESYAVIDDFVEVIDPLTFIIHTPVVIAELEFFVAHSRNFPIESKARWDAIGHEGYGDAIVGTGPLKFIERKEGIHVRYEAVPDHWRHTPDYQELEFRWVQEPATRLATLLTEDVHLSDIERASRPQALKKGMTIIRSSQPAMFNKWYFGGLW